MLTYHRYAVSTALKTYFRHLRVVMMALALGLSGSAVGETADIKTQSFSEKLQALHAQLEPALKNSPFQQPLLLQSTESSNSLVGEIFAVVNYPFDSVDTELKSADNWCDVLILHLNIKFCRAISTQSETYLTVHIGTKREQSLDDSYPLKFRFQQSIATPGYFQIQLNAPEGPLSTRNFRIMLEAAPSNNKQTFLHFTYAYDYGFAGRLAMKSYLATIGHDKVGFTNTGAEAGGAPVYVDGVRGLTERNTLRYYLAIDAYLKAKTQTVDQFEKSLDYWFAATERFPRQLYEVERSSYLTMKRREYARQQKTP
jgi:hypothetical protein